MPDAGEKPSRFKRILDLLKRLLGKNPASPGDPYACSCSCATRPKDAAAPPSPRSKMIPSAAFLAPRITTRLLISPPAW